MTDLTRRALLAGAAGAGAAVLITPALGGTAPTAFNLTPAEWRRKLGPARYAVLRQGETERPGSSPLLAEHRKGLFACAGCALPIFASQTKFDSGTGWPSFWQALPRAIATRPDHSLGMERIEVLCSRCRGHLGHVFDDGPKPTGLRYCMNGLALTFRPA
jgi:peptide-methionine (R)-S-oxide reductase